MTHACGAVVLCGGRSTRFGSPKADFPVAGVPMLRRVVDAVSAVCSPVIVVAAAGQTLPALPSDVLVLADERPECGPLHGLAVGLRALAGFAKVGFAASCDLPWLHPAFVRAVLAQLGDHHAAVPCIGDRLHPLAAAYRTECAAVAWAMLHAGERRMTDFLAKLDAHRIDAANLPELASLTNVNTPADLEE